MSGGTGGAGNAIGAFFKSVLSRSDRSFAQQEEYFTPRLAEADRLLRLLATRIKGSYRRGAVTWSAFTQNLAQSAPEAAPLDSVWGRDIYIDERTVDVHIGRLRKLLNPGREQDPIRTVRGAGYALDDRFAKAAE